MPFKILLIEAERRLRETHRRELEHEGYRVVESDSSAAGLEMLETAFPDLVVIDPDNRDMDGVEAVNRALAHCPRIPVLVSRDETRTGEHLRDLADAVVPARPDRFRDQVRRLLVPDVF